jgi:protein-disulfide isomerase
MDNQEQQLTKRQRRELRHQERANEQERFRRGKTIKKVIILSIVILAVAAGGYGIYRSVSGTTDSNAPIVNNPTLGPTGAKVVITEYSDFSCPACAVAAPIVKEVAAAYPDSVQIAFNSFNLGHRWSEKSLEAGLCAGEQGKFWELGDTLFAKQSEWANESDAVDRMKVYAKEAGLNEAAFNSCLDSEKMARTVSAATKAARDKKINSTPTFYVNDTELVGVQTLEAFKTAIDAALKASQ